MRVLYINYIDFNNIKSGSSVRPAKIYGAMRDLGYDIKMISGISSRKNVVERKEYLARQWEEICDTKFDYCYIEAKTTPIFLGNNRFEYDFIKQIKKQGIPVGLFYRDVYWKFPQLFDLRGLRQLVMRHFQKCDMEFIKKNIDCVFLPSNKMNDYCNFHKYKALPPACEEFAVCIPEKLSKNIIYVGGLSFAYGSDILLEAFRIVNRKLNVNLILICREAEYVWLKQYINDGDYKWLNIIHASSDKLNEYYEKADFAICSHRKNDYHDFCMPVKLFEYISHGKPIIATNCNEINKIITTHGLGICGQDNAESLAQCIFDVYSGEYDYAAAVRNILSYRSVNLWTDRVKTIGEILL